MKAIGFLRLVTALLAAAALWAIATPAEAQLAPGCRCPAGTHAVSSTICTFNGPPVPAICPLRNFNLGQIASGQQQQSFWGINQMLQQKRDALQYTPRNDLPPSGITGYTASPLDENTNVLGYSGQSQKDNPLASKLFDQTGAPSPPAPVLGVWAQGLGEWEHDDPLSTTDLARSVSTYTAQLGFDRTQQSILSADDAFVLGIVTSWINTNTNFDGESTTMKLSGPGVGVYTEYVRGGFSTDLTAKFDFLGLTQNFGGLQPNVSINVLNAGLSGNAQYKFTGENNNFIEPTMGFTLTHTGFGSGAAALNLEDAYTVRLQAGARIGTTWDFGHDVTVDTNLKALVYGDAVAQGTAATVTSATPFALPSISASDTGLVRMELDPELCFNLQNGYSVTLSGQVRYGQALVGGSAGINLRKQW